MSTQYIYMLRAGENTYKIGISKNMAQRTETLAVGNPVKIIPIWHTNKPIYNARKIEIAIHRHYKSNNIYGEWFLFTDIDGVIEKIKKEVKACGILTNPKKSNHLFKNPFDSIHSHYQGELRRLKKERAEITQENKRQHNFLNAMLGVISAEDSEYMLLVQSVSSEQKRRNDILQLISGLINCGWGYDKIKEFVSKEAVPMAAIN